MVSKGVRFIPKDVSEICRPDAENPVSQNMHGGPGPAQSIHSLQRQLDLDELSDKPMA